MSSSKRDRRLSRFGEQQATRTAETLTDKPGAQFTETVKYYVHLAVYPFQVTFLLMVFFGFMSMIKGNFGGGAILIAISFALFFLLEGFKRLVARGAWWESLDQ